VGVNLRLNYKVGSLQDMAERPSRIQRALLAAFLVIVATVPARAQSNGASSLTSLRTRPGDRIAVIVARELELTDTVMVNESGEAAFAKLGLMRVDTMSIKQLQEMLREQYSRYLRNPAIEITVLRRIAVQGEVRSPNVYLVDVTTPVRDLIARANGLTDAANRKKIYIIRDGQRIKVENWESDVSAAAELRSGDQVLVGRKNWLVLNALPVASTAATIGFLIIAIQNQNP
jgi:protein involved in polysaccharide export with SLBB domain